MRRDGRLDLTPDCGDGCVAVMCCRGLREAGLRLCGCGGGYDHSDCPTRDDWRATLDGEEVGAGWTAEEAMADARSVTEPGDWPRIELEALPT